MARAIDGSELMLEIQACRWDSDQDRERAEDLVLGMPTLTQPNEPLQRCAGEDISIQEVWCLDMSDNKALTLERLREMDGEPVWVEDVKHWALIDIEKGGQWDGVPFAIWAENGVKFTYNVEIRNLHCYRSPPEREEGT